MQQNVGIKGFSKGFSILSFFQKFPHLVSCIDAENLSTFGPFLKEETLQFLQQKSLKPKLAILVPEKDYYAGVKYLQKESPQNVERLMRRRGFDVSIVRCNLDSLEIYHKQVREILDNFPQVIDCTRKCPVTRMCRFYRTYQQKQPRYYFM
jgi:hypothetical protein